MAHCLRRPSGRPAGGHCRFSADPDACSAPDAPHPTKKIQRSPAGRDQSTGADSSLCNKSGSSSTLKRLVCASGGRRTMANPMRYGARCSTQSTSSPLPAPKWKKVLLIVKLCALGLCLRRATNDGKLYPLLWCTMQYIQCIESSPLPPGLQINKSMLG